MSIFWFNAGSNSLRYELILNLFSRWRNWGIERISIFQGLKARNGEGRIWTLEVISGVQTLYLYAVMLLRCHRRIRPWQKLKLTECLQQWHGFSFSLTPLRMRGLNLPRWRLNTRHISHSSCPWKLLGCELVGCELWTRQLVGTEPLCTTVSIAPNAVPESENSY